MARQRITTCPRCAKESPLAPGFSATIALCNACADSDERRPATPIHDVGPVAEDWRSRGAPLSGTDATALGQAKRILAVEAARLHDEASRAGAGPEVLREAIACEEGAGALARLIARRGVQVGPGGLR